MSLIGRAVDPRGGIDVPQAQGEVVVDSIEHYLDVSIHFDYFASF
jgi:hypothetical protein